MGYNISLASISSFLPTILDDLGYHGASAQIRTVPPYTCAFFVMILSAMSSDKLFKERGLHLTVLGVVGATGYLSLLLIPAHFIGEMRW